MTKYILIVVKNCPSFFAVSWSSHSSVTTTHLGSTDHTSQPVTLAHLTICLSHLRCLAKPNQREKWLKLPVQMVYLPNTMPAHLSILFRRLVLSLDQSLLWLLPWLLRQQRYPPSQGTLILHHLCLPLAVELAHVRQLFFLMCLITCRRQNLWRRHQLHRLSSRKRR